MRISKEKKLCLAMKCINVLNSENKEFVQGVLFTLSALDIDTKFLGNVQLTTHQEKSVDIPLARNNAKPYITPRPLEDWHEDQGACLWWHFPVCEEPYVGSPLDNNFPSYVTHYTPIFIPTLSNKEV